MPLSMLQVLIAERAAGADSCLPFALSLQEVVLACTYSSPPLPTLHHNQAIAYAHHDATLQNKHS